MRGPARSRCARWRGASVAGLRRSPGQLPHDSPVLAYRPPLGRGVYVGDTAVLDIGTSMGDGAQLGHSSALHSGQAVPAGERWHGSPAQRTETNFVRVPPAECGSRRRAVSAALTLLGILFV